MVKKQGWFCLRSEFNGHRCTACAPAGPCRIASVPCEACGSNDDIMNAAQAAFQHCLDDQRDGTNPGSSSWTFPIIRMMNCHIANYARLPFILMAGNEADDVRVGRPLRERNSRLIWVNDPSAGERVQVIVESRPGVIQLIEQHLNRNGDNYRMAQDLGPPPPVAQAPPDCRRGRRRSFD